MSQVPKIWTLILCFEKFSRNWKLKDKKWILYIEKRKISPILWAKSRRFEQWSYILAPKLKKFLPRSKIYQFKRLIVLFIKVLKSRKGLYCKKKFQKPASTWTSSNFFLKENPIKKRDSETQNCKRKEKRRKRGKK